MGTTTMASHNGSRNKGGRRAYLKHIFGLIKVPRIANKLLLHQYQDHVRSAEKGIPLPPTRQSSIDRFMPYPDKLTVGSVFNKRMLAKFMEVAGSAVREDRQYVILRDCKAEIVYLIYGKQEFLFVRYDKIEQQVQRSVVYASRRFALDRLKQRTVTWVEVEQVTSTPQVPITPRSSSPNL